MDETNAENKLNNETNADNKLNNETNAENKLNNETNAENKLNNETNAENKLNNETNAENKLNNETNAENKLNNETNAENKLNNKTNAENKLNNETNAENKLNNETKTDDDVTKIDKTVDSEKKVEVAEEAKVTRKTLKECLPDITKGVVEEDDVLPNKPPTEIRIFVASTFRDFPIERDYILKHIYDALRELCQERFQRDFILIDLRWGVTSEWCFAVSEQKDTEICLYEVEKSRTESIGPNFVAFLSHQYGSKLEKLVIEREEFELIKEYAKDVRFKDMNLLEYAYELDENGKNKQFYKLKSTDRVTKELNIKKEEWWKQIDILKKLIQDTVKKMLKKKAKNPEKYDDIDFDEKRKESYFTSGKSETFMHVTHQEVEKGILEEPNPGLKSVAFFRDIIGLERSGFKTEKYKLYMDEDEKTRMKKLREEVGKKLAQNKAYFEVEWSKANNFEKPYTEEIENYLKRFGEEFKFYMVYLINRNIEALESDKQDPYHLELLHHAIFCNRLVKPLTKDITFRPELIDKLKGYLDDEKNNKPFIVTGKAGSGKSTLLAYTIKKLRNEEDIFIFRFMGTSKESSTMKSVMLSILEQLDRIYGKSEKPEIKETKQNAGEDEEDTDVPKVNLTKSTKVKIKKHKIKAVDHQQDSDSKRPKLEFTEESDLDSDLGGSSSSDEDDDDLDEIPNDESSNKKRSQRKPIEPFESNLELKYRFERRLKELSSENKISSRLVIVLDSLDQLSKYDVELDWFISVLPDKVKMIYSVIPEHYYGILRNIQRILPDNSNYLNLETLSIKDAREMLQALLDTCDRTITGSEDDTTQEEATDNTSQWFHVNKIFDAANGEIYPLHVKILFDIAKTWTSSYKVDEKFSTCLSTNDTIKYLFEKFERLHKPTLFSRCVFYLSLFEYNGISESEIEDILSIDDDVLTEIFEFFHPPVRRFPIALWLKIKYELKDYITNKDNDGVSVISWFHRSFFEAAKDKYKHMFENADEKDKLLMNVIDYFIETYNEKKSDGSTGLEKEFEFNVKKDDKNSKAPNDFKKTDIGNDIVYRAYRNTRSQKMKYQFRDNKSKVIYNKRKLNELVNVISMLSNTTKKIELLKEYVYFNYEFMLAKCELRQFDFVFDIHPKILELKENLNDDNINELVEISDIYRRIHQPLFNYPELLNVEVMSRLNSRSKYTEMFSKIGNLHMVSKGYVKDSSRDLYIVNPNWKLTYFHIEHEGSLVFVQSVKIDADDSPTILHVIDMETAVSIGNIDLIKKASALQILLEPENGITNKITKASDINGLIYYSNEDTIYISTFLREFRTLKEFPGNKINNFILLNPKKIVVLFKTSFVLLDLVGNKSSDKPEEFEMGDNIQIVETTIPKNTVFSSTFLESVDTIIFIVGLEVTKVIKIYLFNNETGEMSPYTEINSMKWNYFGWSKWFGEDETWKESIIIEDVYMINKKRGENHDNSRFIRFVLQEERHANSEPIIATVVEVTTDKSVNMDFKLTEKDFDIDDGDKASNYYRYKYDRVFLEAFVDGRVVVKLRYDMFQWIVYILNLEIKLKEDEETKKKEIEVQAKQEDEETKKKEIEVQAKQEDEETKKKEIEVQAKQEDEETKKKEIEVQAKQEDEETKKKEIEVQAKQEDEETKKKEIEVQAKQEDKGSVNEQKVETSKQENVEKIRRIVKRKIGHWTDAILNMTFISEGNKKIFVGKQRNGLRFYDVDDYAIRDVSSVPILDLDSNLNKFNACLSVKNGKLLQIDPENDSTIKEIEFSTLENNNVEKIHMHNEGIEDKLDDQHILIRIERENKEGEEEFELRVFDIIKEKTVASLEIGEPMKVILFNSHYLVLFSYENRYIKVFEFSKKQDDDYEFNELLTNRVDDTSLLKGCFNDERNSSGFIHMMFNEHKEKKCIELRHLNEDDETKMEENFLNSLQLDGIELEFIETDYVITPSSKFLILYDKWKRIIYYVDYVNKKVKHKVTVEGENENVDTLEPTIHCVGNTDNLILHSLRKIHFIQFHNRDETFTQMVLKEYNSFRFSVFLEQNHLFVRMKDYKYMEIYKTHNLEVNQIDDSLFKEAMFVNKRVRDEKRVPIHIDDKYLIIGTDDDELCVYELATMEELACLPLNGTITSLVVNEQWIIIGLKSDILKFELIKRNRIIAQNNINSNIDN